MAIAIAIPFPRPGQPATGDRPRRAAPVAAQPGARVYSPYGRRRLVRPMAVPHPGAASEGAFHLAGGRLRLPFIRSRRG